MYKINITKDEFMSNCVACGGNWTAMLLTGIKATNPELYTAMPERSYEFCEVGTLVNLMCTDNETDLDQAFDVFKKNKDLHHYWVDCLLRSTGCINDNNDAIFQALLWVWKRDALDALDEGKPGFDFHKAATQLQRLCDYQRKFEEYLANTGKYFEDNYVDDPIYACDIDSLGQCPYGEEHDCSSCHNLNK